MIRELCEHEIKALHHEIILKDIMTVAENLPPFPDIVWKVIPLLRKMAPIQEIESVIRYDQAIAARVLSLSQSAYYRRRHDVRSLQDAIIILGGQKLTQVIITACATRYFQGKVSGYELNERELWEHSVATAILAEVLARRLKQNKVLTIYTAALLHDIGKTVLDLYAKIYLETTLDRVKRGNMDIIEAERKALSIDHQELGKYIARRWQFPPEVVVAIAHHHSPLEAKSDQETASTIYVANRLAGAIDIPETMEILPKEDPVFKRLGVTHSIVKELQEKLNDAMGDIKQYLAVN